MRLKVDILSMERLCKDRKLKVNGAKTEKGGWSDQKNHDGRYSEQLIQKDGEVALYLY